MNLVATTFATQPICNATWAAHALRSDQSVWRCIRCAPSISLMLSSFCVVPKMWFLVASSSRAIRETSLETSLTTSRARGAKTESLFWDSTKQSWYSILKHPVVIHVTSTQYKLHKRTTLRKHEQFYGDCYGDWWWLLWWLLSLQYDWIANTI